tara:strand:- start:1059 stop:2000 length:942 start_codon:yes stop_codon:yes gene_type:complete
MVQRLRPNQRAKFQKLKGRLAAGETLGTNQQAKYNQLTNQKAINRTANQTANPNYTAGEAAVGDFQAEKQIQYGNADQNSPFYSQTTRIDPVTGIPVQTSQYSDAQQGLKDQGESLSKLGNELATKNLQGYQKFGFNSGDQRQKITDSVFSRLNRDTEMNRGRDIKAVEQQLYNRGIPYSADPNSQYQQMIGDTNRRYDDQTADYNSRADELAGAEMQRSFGMDFSTHQQGLADTTQLQQQGIGLQGIQPQGFAGGGYQLNDPTQTDLAFQGLEQRKKEGNAQIDQNAQALALRRQQMAQGNEPQDTSGLPQP